LVAKFGAGAFGTIIAPILVALILKHFDSPTPPTPAVAGPTNEQAGQKTAPAAVVPVSSGSTSTAKPLLTPAVSPAPAPAAAPVRPAEPSTSASKKPELASASEPAHSKGKKKKSALAAADVSAVSPGFTLLFNGRNLSGWTGGDNRWSVDLAAHALVGHNFAGTKGHQHAWLYTERNFADFRLRFEYRALPQSDSGIALRVSQARIDERFEIQLLGDQDHLITTGTIIGLRANNAHPNTKPSTPVTLRPQGDWNVVEIDLRGPRLRMTINGKAAQDVRFDEHADSSAPGKRMGDSGRIALQSRTGHVEFRKVEIQELKPAAGRPGRSRS
jgi:hypothetical protein